MDIPVHVLILQEIIVIHVLEDSITNVNETIKAPLNLNIGKDKLKQFSASILIGFEFDPNISSLHASSGNEFDHVLNNYL